MKRTLSHISLTAREELEEANITVSVIYPYITLTDFEENTIKTPSNEENGGEEEGEYEGPTFKFDSAEYVAQKIVEGIESEEAEIFAHD